MDSNYTKCFMLDNFNPFNSEWGLSFSDRSYPEKTQKKINGLVGQKIDPYVTIGSWRVQFSGKSVIRYIINSNNGRIFYMDL